MSIKQNGGIFGRNPTFNDVTIEGQLTFDGDIDVNSDLTVGGDLEVAKATGTSSPDPVELKLRTQSNGSSWSLTDPWGVIDFYSDDSSAAGPKSQVQIQAIATNTNGGNSGLDFKLYNTTATELQSYLKISNGGSNSTRHVDITGPGGLYLTGGGNVIMNNGAGIDFSATSGTGTSELFDDYEEGTWTPTLVGSTSAGTATFVSGPTGFYTKIGNQVTVYFDWNISAHTGTGALRVNGLPFALGSGVGVGAIMDGNYTYSAGRTRLVPYVVGSVLRFYQVGSGVGYIENALDTSHQINGSVTYTV